MKYVKFILKWGVVVAIMIFVTIIAFRFGLRLRNDPWVKMVDAITNPVEKTATEIYGYKPEFYFSDTKMLEICHAIDKRNMDKVDRLLSGEILPFGKRSEKVDVNTRGKDNMTLLLWASQLYIKGPLLDHIFFNNSNQKLISDDKKEREFLNLYQKERLNCIEHLLVFGADPNIKLTRYCDIGIDYLGVGISVVFIAAVNYFPGDKENYLPLVLKYGGNPNIVYTEYNATPIFAACNPSKTFGNNNSERKGRYFYVPMGADHLASPYNVGLLIEAGADIEFRDKWQNTPLIAAAGGENFDIVLMLLEAGADYTAENEDGENLAYFLYLAKHNNPKIDTPESIDPYYNKVIDFLKNKNYSLENAYVELGDKLKNLPEPPKELNTTSDYDRRLFDPYADEWIQKRKTEQMNNNL